MLALDQAQQLGQRLLFFDNRVADVGPVKAADKLARVFELQALHNVRTRQVVGGGGQGHARHTRETLVQNRQATVLGAKVVPPLAHAVGFVNRKQTQQTALVHLVEQSQKAWRGHPLGGGVKQSDVATEQALLHRMGLLATQGRIEQGRAHPHLQQSAHLVVHQRDQGRDHHCHTQASALPCNGWYLVTQRLAPASGHQHQGVTPLAHMANDVGLWAAKLVVAKHLAQQGVQGLWCQLRPCGRAYICSHGNPSWRQPLTLER